MSTKEMIYELINGFSDEQLKNVLSMLESLKNIVDEAEDEAYCNKLYDDYKADEATSDTVNIEDFAKELGIEL